MSDIYDAVYQAARSKISQCSTEDVLISVLSGSFGNVDHYFQCLCEGIEAMATKPHVLMRPKILKDGNKWSVLYGNNLQEGVCGFGDSPEEACCDFDRNWLKKIEENSD